MQWRRLESHLPPEKPWTRRSNAPHRRILNGVLAVLRTGAPWHDLPRGYGPVGPVSSRFYRWRACGTWDGTLSALQAVADACGEVDWNLHFVDATIIRAHQHAAGARRDGTIEGEVPAREALLDQGAIRRPERSRPRLRPRRAAGDKGYNSPTVRRRLRQRHMRTVIPSKSIQRAANYLAMVHIGMLLLSIELAETP